ncbi:hypothetical protein ACFOKI_06595 [Sphingomonas qilianensis]|uniref:MarR family transcriptional regulator n=1 Tax=Sphingomonas qilianensis TaxID=1736690 RepID=A0ABU9XTP5_9SPHN
MTSSDEFSKLASAILKFRRYRSTVLPDDIFNEPAWELLLELFLADSRGERLTAREVADRSGTPGPVMSCWLQHLTGTGLLVGDGTGNLDDALTLSGAGMAGLENILTLGRALKNELTPGDEVSANGAD